jgi:hypothetical protein
MSVTAGGSNIVAFFPVMWDHTSGGAITAISYNGVSILSNVACGPTSAGGNDNYAEIFYYINPPTGTKTLAITGNSSVNEIYYNIVSFTGVNQTTPVRSGTCQTSAGTTGGSTSTVSVTITSNTSDLTMTAIDMNALSSTNQTSDGINTGGSLAAGSDHATTAASSVTHTWTATTSDGYALVGFSVQVASTAHTASMSESNIASDAVARKVSFGRGPAESNTASDAVARRLSFGRGDSESNTA